MIARQRDTSFSHESRDPKRVSGHSSSHGERKSHTVNFKWCSLRQGICKVPAHAELCTQAFLVSHPAERWVSHPFLVVTVKHQLQPAPLALTDQVPGNLLIITCPQVVLDDVHDLALCNCASVWVLGEGAERGPFGVLRTPGMQLWEPRPGVNSLRQHPSHCDACSHPQSPSSHTSSHWGPCSLLPLCVGYTLISLPASGQSAMTYLSFPVPATGNLPAQLWTVLDACWTQREIWGLDGSMDHLAI